MTRQVIQKDTGLVVGVVLKLQRGYVFVPHTTSIRTSNKFWDTPEATLKSHRKRGLILKEAD